MISSNNQMSKEQFINQIAHPRKKEMAAMIIDGASFEELQAQNFSRTSVQEMTAKIKVHVMGMESFRVGGEIVEAPAAATETGSSDSGPNESGPSESGSSDSGPSDSGSSESKSLV